MEVEITKKITVPIGRIDIVNDSLRIFIGTSDQNPHAGEFMCIEDIDQLLEIKRLIDEIVHIRENEQLKETLSNMVDKH